jgi:diguanylate cyclase (GGDEF)-like protein/PAS domain S-box-containing protein
MMPSNSKPSLSAKLAWSHLLVAAIGASLLLIAVSVNYHLTSRIAEMTNSLEPQSQAATELLVGLNKSLAALRGWVSLNEPRLAEQWQTAWRDEIKPALAALEALAGSLSAEENLSIQNRLKPLLNDLDESQWWVMQVAQTPGNQPARAFYEQNVLPSERIVARVIRDLENLAVESDSAAFTAAVLAVHHRFDELLWVVSDVLNSGDPNWENQLVVLEQQLLMGIAATRDVAPLEAGARLDVLDFESAALVRFSRQAIALRLSPDWNRAKRLMEVETVPLADEVSGLVEFLATNAQLRVNRFGAQTARASQLTGLIMMLLAVAVIGAAWWVARTRARDIARPILQLEGAATALRDGVLDRDIVIGGTRELESLSASFNDMRSHLEQSRRALSEANETLEKRVRARTRELALANQMLDQVHEVAYLADEDGRIRFVNDEACRMLGYSRDQLLELRLPDVDAHTSSQSAWTDLWARVKEQGSIIFESCHLDAHGREIPVEVSATFIHFEGREYVIGLVRDVTERKRAEESLRSQERFISAIADASPALVYVFDLDISSNIYVNSGIEQLLGYTPEAIEAMGERLLERLVHPDDLPAVMDLHARIRKATDDAVLSIDYRMRHNDGTWRVLHSDERVFLRHSDGSVKQKVGIAVDVTAQKETERQLSQAAAVFSSTVEGIAITDTEAKILDVNQSFCDITGYSREEVIGRNPRLLQSGKHDQAFYEGMWRSLLDTGHWRGEIWNRAKSGRVYPELLSISAVRDSDGKTTGYVSAFSDITLMKQTEDRLDHLAHHDALTGLPNRLLFGERLKQSIRRARSSDGALAVVFTDLDRFKNVNDSLGHQYGDELLKQVSDRLSGLIRAEDTLARISGDEFVVLLEGIATAADAAVVVDKMMGAFQTPHRVLGAEIRMTCSMGISLFPSDGEDASELMRNADAAMYRAKDDGRNTYQFYSSEMTSAALEHVVMENALRSAIKNDEFFLVFQPQYELGSGALMGVETLLRWRHPQWGLVSPGRFISIAEQSGQIRDIGRWVLSRACRQGKEWIDQGYDIGRIAINVSGQQVQREDFLAEVASVLDSTGLPAGRLEIEVTETFFMKSAEQAIGTLQGLKDLGVQVSIDDFGTGYSSMLYLKRLPVTRLKIDQSFVRDIPDDGDDVEIVRAMVAMCRSLRLGVIAEGIETQDQLNLLREMGCTHGQGYLLCVPLPCGEVEQRFGMSGAEVASHEIV